MSRLLVSVVITCHNYGRFLGAAIESALAQRYPATEVLVVDDGSTDDSRDIIARYAGQVVAVIKPHGGQGSAFNAGFLASRGDVVCFLDADDMLAPDAVARAAQRLGEPGVVKVHWTLATVDEAGRPLGSLQPAQPLPEGDLLGAVVSGGPAGYLWPVTSGNAWARHFLERVLPMPEDAYRGSAESYLAALAPAFGRIARVTGPLGSYRMHESSVSNRRLVGDLMRATALQHEALAQAFAKLGITVDTTAWPPTPAFRDEVVRTTEELAVALPHGAVFAFVEWNQWGPGDIVPGLRAVPFPERRGQFDGRPANDDTAIDELARFRAAGGTHLVFAWPALWWLDYYRRFADHLRSRFRLTASSDRIVVFDLGIRTSAP
jgi:hypothetical protein